MNFRRSVIIAVLWRPEVARLWNFVRNCVFFVKTTSYGKIFIILFRKFLSRRRSKLCSDFVKFGRREISKIERYLVDKNKLRLPLKLSHVRIAPKICQGQPKTMYSECSRFHPNRFTFPTREHRQIAHSHRMVNPLFGRSTASSRRKTGSRGQASCSTQLCMWQADRTLQLCRAIKLRDKIRPLLAIQLYQILIK